MSTGTTGTAGLERSTQQPLVPPADGGWEERGAQPDPQLRAQQRRTRATVARKADGDCCSVDCLMESMATRAERGAGLRAAALVKVVGAQRAQPRSRDPAKAARCVNALLAEYRRVREQELEALVALRL